MNGRIKPEKESLVFFSHKKFLLLPSHLSKHPCTCYATTVLLLSHRCRNVILKLRYRPSALSLLRAGSSVKHRV